MSNVLFSHIVVYDDRGDDAALIASSMSTYLASRGLPARVDAVTADEEVRNALLQHADMWICDVSLNGDDDDSLGLDFIGRQKPKFPHVAFGIMTANQDQLQHLGEGSHYPDFFFPKPLISPAMDAAFGEQVLSTVLTHTRQNRAFELIIPQFVEGALKHALNWPKFDRSIVECLIRQVFSSSLAEGQHLGMVGLVGRAVKIAEPVFDRVELQPLSNSGRSGSAVVKAVLSMGGRPHKVSVVLKFCELEPFSQELHNFSRYVKWTLPFSWRVDLLGTGVVGRLGLIAYSLAFEGASDAIPLSHAIAEGRTEPVQHLLDTMFDSKQQIWYGARAQRDDSLGTHLTTRYFGTGQKMMQKRRVAFESIVTSKVFRAWSGSNDPRTITVLKNWAGRLTVPSYPYTVCICHGDLHGGNIMMAPNGSSMVFIDFQETGFQHVFTDFVFVENAVRKDGQYEWPPIETLVDLEIAYSERALAGMQVAESGFSGLDLIAKIRESAFLNFPNDIESPTNYLLNSVLFAIRMLNSSELGEQARERLCAHVVGITHVLGGGGGTQK